MALDSALVAQDATYVAHTYHPLPVAIATGEGAWVTDTAGNRYLDGLAGYSALNFGHRHPALIAAAKAQLDRCTLTSRAFFNDKLGPFAEALTKLAGMEVMLPMNSGAEGVESALKVARKWAYDVKGVPDGQAQIIVAGGNFHGRTISIISFSDDPDASGGFGPHTPGFVRAEYGNVTAIADAITPNTAAVLLEPIQGEGGVIIPPADYLPSVRALCDANNVLLIADEIQSGLGRTGTTFACELSGVVPDLYILGKALGGGIVPVSAVVGRHAVMDAIRPGQHGSTFGGNPLASAVGHAVVDLLATGEYQRRSQEMGEVLDGRLREMQASGDGLLRFRRAGLWAGLDIDPAIGTGRALCERLLGYGVLAKDTHGSTVRLAPPLCVTESDIDHLVTGLRAALRDMARA